MRDYLKELQEMVKELQANDRVDIETLQLVPATAKHKAQVEALLKLHGEAAEPIAPFYSQVASMELVWWSKAPEATREFQSWSGCVKLLPMEAIFRDWADCLWFDFHEKDHPFRSIRPFDFFIAEACTVLYPVPGKPTVAYHYCGEELETTGYDFDGWFDRLLQSRGWWYWVQALTPRGKSSTEADWMRERLPQVFPNVDLRMFKPGKGARNVY